MPKGYPSADYNKLNLNAETASRVQSSSVPNITDNKRLLIKRDTWYDQINQRVYDPSGVSSTLQISGTDGNYTLDTNGLSGTLVIDDGVNFRVTQVFTRGVLTSVNVGASVAGGATWTPA